MSTLKIASLVLAALSMGLAGLAMYYAHRATQAANEVERILRRNPQPGQDND